jgi:hypothetical protein
MHSRQLFFFTRAAKGLLYISRNFLLEQSHSSFCVTRGNSPVRSLPLSGFRKIIYRHLVRLLGLGIGPSQGLTRGNIKTHKRQAPIIAPNGSSRYAAWTARPLTSQVVTRSLGVRVYVFYMSVHPPLTLTFFQNGFNVATIHLKTQLIRVRKSCTIRLKKRAGIAQSV